MNRDELIEVMKDGKFVGLTFVKADGQVRKMTCRLGVTNYLKGGTKPYEDSEYNLVTVFDIGKKQYRSVPVDRLLSVRKGKTFVWTKEQEEA